MKRQGLTKVFWIVVAMTSLAMGCATTKPNPALEEARTAYQNAGRDPVLRNNAPVALENAQESLLQAERFWKKGASKEIVDHHAYLTQQKVAIAQERAKLRMAEQRVDQVRAKRQELLLEVRTREAELARRQAEARAKEAERMRQQAEARAREAELARRQAEENRREAEIARLRAEERKRQAELAQLEAKAAEMRAKELASQVAELQARQTERGLVLTLGDVLFDFDKAQLKPGAERVVDKLTMFLKEYPERKVMIEGFTDSIGAEAYNKNLSQRRALSLRDALVRQGIAPDRMKVRGYGEKYPVASNDTPSGRQLNRRVEIIVSDEQGQIPVRTN